MANDKYPLSIAFHRQTSRWFYGPVPSPTFSGPLAPSKAYTAGPRTALPTPASTGVLLDSAISLRHSCRRFRDAALVRDDLGAVLHGAYGVVGTVRLGKTEIAERPVPSGGGLYPLELYVLVRHVEGLTSGIYHYAPHEHALEFVAEPLVEPFLSHMFLGQHWVGEASAIIIVTAVLDRCLPTYGERGYRHLFLESGHVGQNIALVATARGLGSLGLDGFLDHDLSRALRIDLDDEIITFAIALGVPEAGDRASLRQPSEVG